MALEGHKILTSDWQTRRVTWTNEETEEVEVLMDNLYRPGALYYQSPKLIGKRFMAKATSTRQKCHRLQKSHGTYIFVCAHCTEKKNNKMQITYSTFLYNF